MRVLHIVGSLSPEWGGVSRSVTGLASALARFGLEVEIITTRQGKEEQLRPLGTKVETFQRGPLGWWGYARHLGPTIRRAVRRADLVHSHGLWLYPHFVTSRAARQEGKPHIISPRGMLNPWALNHRKFRKRFYARLVEWRNLRWAAIIHAVSDTEAQYVKRLRFPVPVVVVPNGIDSSEFINLPDQCILSERYPTFWGKTILLFLGRIHPIKGLDLLAEAFCEVAKKRDDVVLVLAGPDEIGYRKHIESCLEAGGAKARYIFTGMLRGQERLTTLAGADVFLLPSYSEGFPVAALEAMAAGLPVILSQTCNVSGIKEAGAGFIVDPEPKSLYEAILQLVDNPILREEMGSKGRQLVLANYTWDRVAVRMIETYKRLVAGSMV